MEDFILNNGQVFVVASVFIVLACFTYILKCLVNLLIKDNENSEKKLNDLIDRKIKENK